MSTTFRCREAVLTDDISSKRKRRGVLSVNAAFYRRLQGYCHHENGIAVSALVEHLLQDLPSVPPI